MVVFAVFVPNNRNLEPLIQAALAKGENPPDLRRALDDKVVRWAHHFEEVAVIVIVALMVLKPI